MTDRDGYGLFSFGNRHRRAHRASYELHVGPIPDGLVVRHKCDNPPCVNPLHLEVGTGVDNTNDRFIRGRSARGESGGRAKLTEAQVLEIRSISDDLNYREIAMKFSISRSTVWQIVRRKTWRHI
ncbi:HNH endonuclease [Brevibacterium sp. CCUG 69071]|nr:HNH endonuclease [Brevibacterium sp. CCUG 69071]